jgi:hypothetical protein
MVGPKVLEGLSDGEMMLELGAGTMEKMAGDDETAVQLILVWMVEDF